MLLLSSQGDTGGTLINSTDYVIEDRLAIALLDALILSIVVIGFWIVTLML